MGRRARRILAGLTFGLLAAAGLRGQAWLPPQGEAGISIGYGNLYSTGHYALRPAPGQPSASYAGSMRNQALGIIVGYGITDRFALTAAIPFVTSKYQGPTPHIDPATGRVLTPDDGQYHGYFADYRINLGFQAISGEFALAPFVTGVIPSHDYPTLSHAAPGLGQKQLQLGFAAGVSLDRIVPRTFAELYYDYAFVEEVMDINTNRSDFGFQMGYFITPSLGVRFISSGFYKHGGLLVRPGIDTPEYLVHDKITWGANVSVGGGLAYQLTGNTDVSISYLRSIWGRGGTKIEHGLGFTVSYSFSPEQIIRGLFPPKPDNAPGPLEK